MPLRFPFHGHKNVICRRAIHLRKNRHCLNCPSCRFSLFLPAKHRLNICSNIPLNSNFTFCHGLLTLFQFPWAQKEMWGEGWNRKTVWWEGWVTSEAAQTVRCAVGTEIFVALIRGVVDYSSEFSLHRQWYKQTRERKIIPRGHKTRRAQNSALQELSFSRGGDLTRLHIITYFARASMTLRKILQTSQPYMCRN